MFVCLFGFFSSGSYLLKARSAWIVANTTKSPPLSLDEINNCKGERWSKYDEFCPRHHVVLYFISFLLFSAIFETYANVGIFIGIKCDLCKSCPRHFAFKKNMLIGWDSVFLHRSMYYNDGTLGYSAHHLSRRC